MRMHRGDRGRGNDGTARDLILPHEMNSQLYTVEEALIAGFDRLEGRLGREVRLPTMVQDVD